MPPVHFSDSEEAFFKKRRGYMTFFRDAMPPAGFSPSLRSSCVEEEPAPLFLEAPPIVRREA